MAKRNFNSNRYKIVILLDFLFLVLVFTALTKELYKSNNNFHTFINRFIIYNFKSETDEELIQDVSDLNDKCRDGWILDFCRKRDNVYSELTKRGWCYGTPEQAEYQKNWQLCNNLNVNDKNTKKEENSDTYYIAQVVGLEPTLTKDEVNSISQNLLSYETKIRPAQKNIALAYAASICNIRSNNWYNIFHVAYIMYDTDLSNLFHLTKDEENNAHVLFERHFQDDIAGVTCRSLLNSSTMEQLDEIESKLTGNYH